MSKEEQTLCYYNKVNAVSDTLLSMLEKRAAGNVGAHSELQRSALGRELDPDFDLLDLPLPCL